MLEWLTTGDIPPREDGVETLNRVGCSSKPASYPKGQMWFTRKRWRILIGGERNGMVRNLGLLAGSPSGERREKVNLTLIPWVKNPDGTQGYTWNPITGCLNHNNGLCKGGGFPCYAYRLAYGRLKERYLANINLAPTQSSPPIKMHKLTECLDPFYPRLWPERLWDLPIEEYGKPKGIFVCDMGELFGDWIPERWVKKIFARMWWGRQHRYYLLTKQPQNLPRWSPFPDNCWVGVTATNGDMFRKALYYLEEVKTSVKYISFEPLLTSIYEYGEKPVTGMIGQSLLSWWNTYGITWLIIGACTGTRPDMEALIKRYPDLTLMPWKNKWTAQPQTSWISEIMRAADTAGVPVFLKDNLMPLFKRVTMLDYKQELPSG